MAVRIGIDMDGVLADFATAFEDVERRLFGTASQVAVERPEVAVAQEEEVADEGSPRRSPREQRRRRDLIWNAIHSTPDFWTTLKPLDPGAVRRIHEMMIRHACEVCFITQRPATIGQTVQRQTQRWLHEQGFDMPSVLVISGSRGAAAAALRLNFHVDDSPQNCLDVASDSRARPILIVGEPDEIAERSAKRLRIGVARSVSEALDTLEQQLSGTTQPRKGLMDKLSKIVGWD